MDFLIKNPRQNCHLHEELSGADVSIDRFGDELGISNSFKRLFLKIPALGVSVYRLRFFMFSFKSAVL